MGMIERNLIILWYLHFPEPSRVFTQGARYLHYRIQIRHYCCQGRRGLAERLLAIELHK